MRDYNRLTLCSYFDEVQKCPKAMEDILENCVNGKCDIIPEMEIEETIQTPASKTGPNSLALSQQNSSAFGDKFPVI